MLAAVLVKVRFIHWFIIIGTMICTAAAVGDFAAFLSADTNPWREWI